MRCIKLVLTILNIGFIISGIILIIRAEAYKESHLNIYINLLGFGESLSCSNLIVVAGVFTIFFALFSLFGILRENQCVLNTAKIFLALLLILELASVVLAFSFRSNANYYVHESMTKSIKKYNVVVDLTKAWNFLQENDLCCGVTNYTDWTNLGNSNRSVPDSCCKKSFPGCGYGVLEKDATSNIYSSGCSTTITNWVEENAAMLAESVAIIFIFHVICFLFFTLLSLEIRRRYGRFRLIDRHLA